MTWANSEPILVFLDLSVLDLGPMYATDVRRQTPVIAKSRTERSRKTKIGSELAHVTGDSNITFKVKRSKVKITRPLCSPPCWRVRRLQWWAWERVGHGKLLLRCRLLGGARRFGVHGGGEGRGHIAAAARLQLVVVGLASSAICDVLFTFSLWQS